MSGQGETSMPPPPTSMPPPPTSMPPPPTSMPPPPTSMPPPPTSMPPPPTSMPPPPTSMPPPPTSMPPTSFKFVDGGIITQSFIQSQPQPMDWNLHKSENTSVDIKTCMTRLANFQLFCTSSSIFWINESLWMDLFPKYIQLRVVHAPKMRVRFSRHRLHEAAC